MSAPRLIPAGAYKPAEVAEFLTIAGYRCAWDADLGLLVVSSQAPEIRDPQTTAPARDPR